MDEIDEKLKQVGRMRRQWARKKKDPQEWGGGKYAQIAIGGKNMQEAIDHVKEQLSPGGSA